MTNKSLYRIIRKSSGFTTPDQQLSQHRTLDSARRAFARVNGPAVLIGPDGSIIDHRIA